MNYMQLYYAAHSLPGKRKAAFQGYFSAAIIASRFWTNNPTK